MNKSVAAILILLFLLLGAISVFFGTKIKELEGKRPTVSQSLRALSPTLFSQQLSIVAKNLEVPWALTFLPDRSMLVTERPGRVRFISAEGSLQESPVATLSEVHSIGEGGLLGIARHPQFAANNFVYLYYSYTSTKDQMLNRVVRYVFDGKQLKDKKIIVDAIPGNANHDGGRIKFGPDGFLYITTGDSEEPSLAQNKTSLAGKILRVTDEGKPAPGNPFNTLVYSYGHRNPQGITWDDHNRLWETEHGRSIPLSGFDELNRIEVGKNYGWPTIQGNEVRAGMVTPIANSGATSTWAPSGAAFANGSIFFSGLRGRGLYEAVITGDTVTIEKHFDQELGRIREVVLGPDDMLYITTSNRDGRGDPHENDDKVYKVDPQTL